MTLLRSMPPIVPKRPRLLILGSMPGQVSLNAQQYYANPTNAFWFIMGGIFGFSLTLAYEQRVSELKRNDVALWDVLKHCERRGSGDSEIRKGSEIPNDIAELLSAHPTIEAVFCNGRKSEEMYRRLVEPSVEGAGLKSASATYLPSTSAANAQLSKERKLELWRAAIASRGF